MAKIKNSILLNAEPFGFGPTAAIASIASMLRKEGVSLGYIGEGHTHDLQQAVEYKDRYDLSEQMPEAQTRIWQEAAKKYSIFMTAMDFEAAEQARQAGMRIIIYDALTWYWLDISDTVKKADLYIAQNFYGVQARMDSEIGAHTNTKVVPPIVSWQQNVGRRNAILLNMGGLQNPVWSEAQVVDYSRVMIRTMRSMFPSQQLQIATSRQIAYILNDPDIKTYEVAEMQSLLSRTSLAIMTPGLGNIYDAAAYGVPTVWLPPANDSQAKQLELLKKYNCCDASVGWEDLGLHLDLTVPQPEILDAIAGHVKRLTSDARLASHYRKAMQKAISVVASQKVSKSTNLLREFGSDGVAAIVNEVMQFMGMEMYAGILTRKSAIL